MKNINQPIDDNLRLIFATYESDYIEEQYVFYKQCLFYCAVGLLSCLVMIFLMPAFLYLFSHFDITVYFQYFIAVSFFLALAAGLSGLLAFIPMYMKFRHWKKAKSEHENFLKKYNRSL